MRLSHSAPEIGELVDLTNVAVVRPPLADFPSFPSLLRVGESEGAPMEYLSCRLRRNTMPQSFYFSLSVWRKYRMLGGDLLHDRTAKKRLVI
jgi:hypothetical protein